MELNHVEASLCFPTFPRFCGQTFIEATATGTSGWPASGLQRLDGRGVVRRQRRPPHPPVSHPTVGCRVRGRRGASQCRTGCASRVLQRDPVPPRPAEHPHGHGTRSSPRAARRGPSSACISARPPRCRQHPPTPPPPLPRPCRSTTRWHRWRTSSSPACWCDSRTCASRTRRARSAGCPTSSSASTTCGASTGRGAGCATSSPSRHPPTTTARSTDASSGTTRFGRARQGRSRQHHVRDRLSAHRLHMARNTKRCREDDAGPARRAGLQDRARQRDPHARVGPRPSMKLGDVVNPGAAPMGKPLDGIRILSLEQMQALPDATQLLSRLGAQSRQGRSAGNRRPRTQRHAGHDRSARPVRRGDLPAQQLEQALSGDRPQGAQRAPTSYSDSPHTSTWWLRTSGRARRNDSALPTPTSKRSTQRWWTC